MKPLLALFALLGLLSACGEYSPGTYTGEPIVEEADGDSDDSDDSSERSDPING